MIILTNTYIIDFLQTVENIGEKLFNKYRDILTNTMDYITLKIINVHFSDNNDELRDYVAKHVLYVGAILGCDLLPLRNTIYGVAQFAMYGIFMGTILPEAAFLYKKILIPRIMSIETYIKYCNFMKVKRIDMHIFPLRNKNDIMKFNKIKFNNNLKCLTIVIIIEESASEFVNEIIFPNTIEELNIISKLNYFNGYIFNENIKTIGYDNRFPDSFDKYDTMNNLHIQNYVALQNIGEKIKKTPYRCTSCYYSDYYDDDYCYKAELWL